jgi:hypothetical protein
VHSAKAIYRLAAVDVFQTDAKAFHVAARAASPPPPARPPALVGDVALPPVLIFNIQLPQLPPGFFGPSDGPGQSIVYYFVLPEARGGGSKRRGAGGASSALPEARGFQDK